MKRRIAMVTLKPREGRQDLAHGIRVCVRTHVGYEKSRSYEDSMVCKSLILHSSVEFSHRLISRGSRVPALPPSPSPAGRGRGRKRGWGPFSPGLSPWATIFRPYRGWCDLHHESLGRGNAIRIREGKEICRTNGSKQNRFRDRRSRNL